MTPLLLRSRKARSRALSSSWGALRQLPTLPRAAEIPMGSGTQQRTGRRGTRDVRIHHGGSGVRARPRARPWKTRLKRFLPRAPTLLPSPCPCRVVVGPRCRRSLLQVSRSERLRQGVLSDPPGSPPWHSLHGAASATPSGSTATSPRLVWNGSRSFPNSPLAGGGTKPAFAGTGARLGRRDRWRPRQAARVTSTDKLVERRARAKRNSWSNQGRNHAVCTALRVATLVRSSHPRPLYRSVPALRRLPPYALSDGCIVDGTIRESLTG